VYHLQLRQFPHNAARFNLTEQELRAVLEPWVREKFVALGERKWSPHQARITILEGPALATQDLTMGRGWRAAERGGEDVTERVLAQAEQAQSAAARVGEAARGAPAPAGESAEQLASLLGADPVALLEAWRLAAERRPELAPSESLALAESTLRLLDGGSSSATRL